MIDLILDKLLVYKGWPDFWEARIYRQANCRISELSKG